MNPQAVDHIITAIKQLSEIALAAVGVGFTIYNTIVSNINSRQIVKHQEQLSQLQILTPPPGSSTEGK